MSELTETRKANGLETVLNTIIAPKEAFEALQIVPTWGWAFIITEILVLVGSIIMLPAFRHAFEVTWAMQAASNPQMSQMSPEQLAHVKAIAEGFSNITPLFALLVIPISMLVQTVIMLIFNALGRGRGNFQTFWAAIANIAVIGSGIASIILAIIVMVHGAQNVTTSTSIQSLMPSLALLVPNASVKLAALLAQLNPFNIWAAILVGYAMIAIAKVPKLHAWLTGIIILLLPAAFAAAFAR